MGLAGRVRVCELPSGNGYRASEHVKLKPRLHAECGHHAWHAAGSQQRRASPAYASLSLAAATGDPSMFGS